MGNSFTRIICSILYANNDEYFMAKAVEISEQSEQRCKVGACIVDCNGQIVSSEYNTKGIQGHAEHNAFKKINKRDVKDGTIYVTLFPCEKCAELIILSGIKTVIYKSDKTSATKRMFYNAGIEYRQYLME